jgi:hypothetical protein
MCTKKAVASTTEVRNIMFNRRFGIAFCFLFVCGSIGSNNLRAQQPAEEGAIRAVPPAEPTPLKITVGATTSVQMKSKRPITEVKVDREGVIQVKPGPNQATLLVTGLKPGICYMTLTDDQGNKETHQMGKPAENR